MAKKWRCTVCGYIHEGPEAPEQCPMCKVGKEKFVEVVEQEGDLDFVTVHKARRRQGARARSLWEGLQNHFMGECTEVGMYLAMSRQADREGYPEIAEAYKRYAWEEAEHASKFAEPDRRSGMGHEDQPLQAHERRVRRLRGQDASGTSGQGGEPRRRTRHGARDGQGRGPSRQGFRGGCTSATSANNPNRNRFRQERLPQRAPLFFRAGTVWVRDFFPIFGSGYTNP